MVSNRTVLNLQKINKTERDIKCWRMVHIINNPGDYDIFSQKPESLSDIYMTVFMEDQCCIVSDNWWEQDELKNIVQVNSIKKASLMINRGR